MVLMRVVARRLLSRGRAYINLRWRTWRLQQKASSFHASRQRRSAFGRWCVQQQAHNEAIASAFAAASALLPIPIHSRPASPPRGAGGGRKTPVVIGKIVGDSNLPQHRARLDGPKQGRRSGREERDSQEAAELDRAERIAEMAAGAAENAAVAARLLAGRGAHANSPAGVAAQRAPARPRMRFHY